MIFQQIPNPNGIDDFKLIGQNDLERAFIQQLAQAGTLTSTSNEASSSVTFRSLSHTISTALNNTLVSSGRIGTLNFTIRQNQNFLVDLAFNSTPPIDLTTYTAIKLQVKVSKHSGAVVTLSLGAGLTISGLTNEVLSVAFSPAQTALLCNSEYYYDIMLSTATSNTYMIEGKISIQRTVTQ